MRIKSGRKTKAEIREQREKKQRFAPRGIGFSHQKKRLEENQYFQREKKRRLSTMQKAKKIM